MMMAGGVQITSPIASRMLTRIRRRKHLDASVVAKALSCSIAPREMVARLPERIEFAKRFDEIDPSDWGDVYGYTTETGRKKRGIAHQIVQQGEFGGRLAGDVFDAIKRGSFSSKNGSTARVGKFKIQENSPNVARITVGPDQRERRKKYAWERVGVQRGIATVGLAGALFAGGKLSQVLARKGGGSVSVGAKNVLGGISSKVQRVFNPAAPQFKPEKFVSEVQKTRIARGLEQKAKNLKEKFPHGFITEKEPHPTIPGKHKYVKKAVIPPENVMAQFKQAGMEHPDAGQDVMKKYKGKPPASYTGPKVVA